MLSRSRLTCVLAIVVQLSLLSKAEAGPLLEWLFGGRRAEPAYPIGGPVPLGVGNAGYGAGYGPGYGYSAGYPSYYGNYYGMSMPAIGPAGAAYPTAIPSGITAATAPSSVFPSAQPMMVQPQPMSFVPNYDSRALRAPVTYYRPLMTTDPNTGAQVVAMAPCTSYQYLTQRVPTFGQSALYGSYQTPTLLPQLRTIPTYSLPSGGVPIAQASPSFSLPQTTLGYGPYTTYQPALVAPPSLPSTSPPSSGYATSPMTSTPYYTAPSGGSAGTIYSTPVPGLSAPQSVPYSSTPSYGAPSYSTPSYTTPLPSTPMPSSPSFSTPSNTAPSTIYPSTPLPSGSGTSPVYPTSPVLPGSDPADTIPSLPSYNGLRPQLRSIVPDVGGLGNESASNSALRNDTRSTSETSRDFPVMSPIPAPQGLEKPRWNPGLLREGDMTALRPVKRFDHYASQSFEQPAPSPATQLIPAGQSKKIVWTSFETTSPESRQVGTLTPSPPTTKSTSPVPRRYDSSGWKASN